MCVCTQRAFKCAILEYGCCEVSLTIMWRATFEAAIKTSKMFIHQTMSPLDVPQMFWDTISNENRTLKNCTEIIARKFKNQRIDEKNGTFAVIS